MKSPFPGMDPYLEARWSDVHPALIQLIKESLQPRLPKALRARSEERLVLEDVEGEPLASYRADLAVVETGPVGDPEAEMAQGVSTIEPVAVSVELPELFDRSVHILDTTSGNRVVTAIEVLSPWNKLPGSLNARYLRKLKEYQAAGVNVVEIDLLRSSRAHLPIPHTAIPKSRRSAYVTCVWFARNPRRWYAYPMPLREALGTIPVPLRADDPVIGLELQSLIERVYVIGGHDDIDYSQPPNPPLADEDVLWAREKVSRN